MFPKRLSTLSTTELHPQSGMCFQSIICSIKNIARSQKKTYNSVCYYATFLIPRCANTPTNQKTVSIHISCSSNSFLPGVEVEGSQNVQNAQIWYHQTRKLGGNTGRLVSFLNKNYFHWVFFPSFEQQYPRGRYDPRVDRQAIEKLNVKNVETQKRGHNSHNTALPFLILQTRLPWKPQPAVTEKHSA